MVSIPKIGIYDSGVGGLSVTDCIRRRIPYSSLYYFCDNLNFPYGTKPDDQIIQCTESNCVKFIDRYGLDLLVIACNTASTIALEVVRRSVLIPVVGVVPAIKPAAAMTQTGVFALLATPATVKRPYTSKLIAEHASTSKVVLKGSSVLVDLAEQKLRGHDVSAAVAREVLQLFAENGGDKIDVVVLGCTHFPLLRPELETLRPDITWIDSGSAIAARVCSLLGRSAPEDSVSPPVDACGKALFSREGADARELAAAMASFGFISLDFL